MAKSEYIEAVSTMREAHVCSYCGQRSKIGAYGELKDRKQKLQEHFFCERCAEKVDRGLQMVAEGKYQAKMERSDLGVTPTRAIRSSSSNWGRDRD